MQISSAAKGKSMQAMRMLAAKNTDEKKRLLNSVHHDVGVLCP